MSYYIEDALFVLSGIPSIDDEMHYMQILFIIDKLRKETTVGNFSINRYNYRY